MNNNQEGTSHLLNSLSSQNNPLSTNKSPRGFISFQNRLLNRKKERPSWIRFHLKRFAQGVKYCASVVINHYLIVLVQAGTVDRRKRGEYDTEGQDPVSLLAFDLLDHSVQEAEINVDLFAYESDYSFIRYGKNHIVKYTNSQHSPESLVAITVDSFKRNICSECV